MPTPLHQKNVIKDVWKNTVKLNRNLNTWLLLFALAVMVSRVLTPFSVPPLVVHDNGFIEVCSWQGGISRVLIDADGNQVESEQPPSHCPQCAASAATVAPELPLISEQALPSRNLALTLQLQNTHPLFVALPPPGRAPPLA
ncbi:MAG: hypothetical protein IBX50_16405 [Marinospirillum sp.]|uniref:hypothetical protein n=1 Tax=Marinospirillum sp. TaxID=2183934 RepID=UPI0019D917F1|nr:hypothetical protein [Marinospirillum sp.]MBE0508272.1 hypothetical protein [Marinospirillum sp.]